MPPVRSVPHKHGSLPMKPVKTERTHEENQERAYIAASRRSDRSLEARVESARRASEIHKRRTGRSLRVTERDVMDEEMYEEEDDGLPRLYRDLAAHIRTGSPYFDTKLEALLAAHVTMRAALQQAINNSYGSSYGGIAQKQHPQYAGRSPSHQYQQPQPQQQPTTQQSMQPQQAQQQPTVQQSMQSFQQPQQQQPTVQQSMQYPQQQQQQPTIQQSMQYPQQQQIQYTPATYPSPVISNDQRSPWFAAPLSKHESSPMVRQRSSPSLLGRRTSMPVSPGPSNSPGFVAISMAPSQLTPKAKPSFPQGSSTQQYQMQQPQQTQPGSGHLQDSNAEYGPFTTTVSGNVAGLLGSAGGGNDNPKLGGKADMSPCNLNNQAFSQTTNMSMQQMHPSIDGLNSTLAPSAFDLDSQPQNFFNDPLHITGPEATAGQTPGLENIDWTIINFDDHPSS